MLVQHEQPKDEIKQALQQQIEDLTAENSLLKQQLAHKEKLVAMIAHELRGPLTPIINYSQIAGRPNASHEKIARATNIITSQAWRLIRLVSDLLDASRLSAGQFSLVLASCDVVAMVKEVVEQLRPVAPYHTLIVEAPDAPIIGNWDCGRLQQALGNLLDNATKYSNEGTTITVRVWQTEDSTKAAHISVHNQGVSLTPEEVGQLFRPYGRLQPGGSKRGYGLGLYITKTIIEEHGGEIRVDPSTADDQGTTFSFDLPIA